MNQHTQNIVDEDSSSSADEDSGCTKTRRRTPWEDWSGLDGRGHTLYGRTLQQAELLDAFQRCCLGKGMDDKIVDESNHRMYPKRCCELVLISGPPGSGKTALANGLGQAVKEASGFFLSGKFDQFERPEDYYPIVHAFTEFARLLEANQDYLAAIYKNVLGCGETNQLVFNAVPALESVFGDSSTATNSDTSNTSRSSGVTSGSKTDEDHTTEVQESYVEKRLEFAFRQFIKVVASQERPIVLMLDDLQWADPASLNLLTALVADPTIEGLMVLGLCRDNEVVMDSQLAVTLRELEANNVGICHIQVGNLGEEAVTEMISDVFSLTATDSLDSHLLSKLVYEETQGNIFFVLHLLRTLSEASLLYKEGGRVMWEPEPVIRATLNLSSPGELIVERLRRLPEDVHEVLQTASCFGAVFSAPHLHLILKRYIGPALNAAEQKGLIQYQHQTESWRFSHDLVQAACYRSIPEEERIPLHLSLGRILWKELGPDLRDDSMLTVVNQLRLGAHLLEDQDERDRAALLLLKAGKKASKSAAFSTAASHLRLGISLLGSRHWRDKYELSVALYNTAAKVEYCIGKHDRVDRLINEALQNSRTTDDRVRALTMKISALGARNDLVAAIDLSLETLRELGVRLPKKAGTIRIVIEYIRAKRMLGRLSDVDVLALPLMREPAQLASMRIMTLLFSNALLRGSTMTPIISCRMVRMTLKHGISGMSAAALAHFAVLVSNGFGNVELGVRIANLCLRLLEKFQTKEWIPRVYFSLFGLVNCSTMPARELMRPLLVAHRVGLVTGDIEYSFHSAGASTILGICAGRSLPKVHSDASMFLELMKAHNQVHPLDLLLPLVQLSLNLMGRSEDPLHLKGEATDYNKAMKCAVASRNNAHVGVLLWSKLILLTFFGDFKEAEQAGKSLGAVAGSKMACSLATPLWYLCHGLAILASGNHSGRDIRVVRTYMHCLKTFASHSKQSFQNKVDLLEAELASTRGMYDLALEKFSSSIAWAEAEGIYSELGLACERAGVTLKKAGRDADSVCYMEKAVEAYRNWGAEGKVADLTRLLLEWSL